MDVRWAEVQEQLQDGSNSAFLCDVVVPGADPTDWQPVLDVLHERLTDWHVDYFEDGERAELPRLAERMVARSTETSVLISVTPSGLPIRGYVFADDWIEFDVPASYISNQERLDALAGFVSILGRALGKEVFATPEAAHDAPIFVYDPAIDDVRTP
jgi:hypothetical protein